jgi:C6 transcription factor Pro1
MLTDSSGCFTCRLRRKKCDEGKPKCKACKHLGLTCEYKRPMWWSNNDQRRRQKEDIKNIIKRTKLSEKSSTLQPHCAIPTPPSMTYSVPTSDGFSDGMGRTRASSEESQDSLEYDFGHAQPPTPAIYDPYAYNMQTSNFPGHAPLYSQPYPYEVDIKTERQMFVNDIPTRRDSSISTFSTFQPPAPHAALPAFPGSDGWVQHDYFETRRDSWSGEEGLDFNFFDFSHGIVPHTSQQALIPVDDCDRRLLDHFVENVLRLIFPILEVNQHGSVKAEVILPALESNKCYLHCCLSIAAIHLKATEGLQSEQVDNDIMRHRYETVSELCKALNRDTDHLQILEATLGMIFFQCSVGRPDDCLPDIPWHQHFQAATSLVHKLELPRIMEEMPATGVHPPFNMTLTSWIDILGSTMLGRSPQFANTYRTKHLTGSTSGLCELMGCEDRVMYLLSEIACLDALKIEKRVDEISLCTHITCLAQQLDATESHNEALVNPFSSTGAIRPRQLSKNMTAVFRIAARVYLCSLVPDYNRYQQSTINLIARLAEVLHFIPSGPDGFDRSLVWPLLICGSYSIPTSPFRRVFAERIERLGEHAEFGSFGRMVRLLGEVWRRADDTVLPTSATCEPTPTSATSVGATGNARSNSNNNKSIQNVHWRDVMQQNGWDFLLI